MQLVRQRPNHQVIHVDAWSPFGGRTGYLMSKVRLYLETIESYARPFSNWFLTMAAKTNAVNLFWVSLWTIAILLGVRDNLIRLYNAIRYRNKKNSREFNDGQSTAHDRPLDLLSPPAAKEWQKRLDYFEEPTTEPKKPAGAVPIYDLPPVNNTPQSPIQELGTVKSHFNRLLHHHLEDSKYEKEDN